MSNKKYSAFERYEFIGEFFTSEDTYSTRFPGKILYDMESGLCLSFNISDSDFPKTSDVLFGVLDNGQKCTLIGPFDFSRTGMRMGKVVTRFGKIGFGFIVMGEFVPIDNQYSHARFTFSHMQEFFYPQGWIDSVKYKEGVIEKIEGPDWTIAVENRASFTDVTHSLKNILFTHNKNTSEKIIESVDSILSETQGESLLIRNNLEFLFRFEPKEAKTIRDIYEYIYRITSLFSIFMNKPVFPHEIQLSSCEEHTVQILAAQSLELRTVELAKSEPSHHFMPINRRSIDLTDSIVKWLDLYDGYQVLSTTFQYETNFRTLHSAYSDIVLYLANIEAIAIDLGTHKESKYVSAIEKYATSELISRLESKFANLNTNELGKNLSDLRGELAHEGRPKKLIKQLNICDFVDIGVLLKLIVVSHLLYKLGFNSEIIENYQNKLISSVRGS